MKESTLNNIWTKLVVPTYSEMNQTHGGLICPDSEKGTFKLHYDEITRHAKEFYMHDKNSYLNRHKVAAAIMIAILQTKPIKKIDILYYQSDINGQLKYWPFNESLAITVALSVLRAFILGRVDYAFSGKPISKQVFGHVIKQDEQIFEKEIPISITERIEWEWELYQIRQDGAYNLLSIAHILKMIERNCRYKFLLENRDLEPIYPEDKYFTEDSVNILTLDDVLGENQREKPSSL